MCVCAFLAVAYVTGSSRAARKGNANQTAIERLFFFCGNFWRNEKGCLGQFSVFLQTGEGYWLFVTDLQLVAHITPLYQSR